MKHKNLLIKDIILIQPEIFSDERGFFFESFHVEKFKKKLGIDLKIVQQNHSGSNNNILRGLHYQIKNTQGKLVRVLQGEVFDVAVDIRRSSATFGMWEGVYLSEVNKDILWIPPGFAHGFYVMSKWAEVEYSTTDKYCPEYERTILWNDPDLRIDWPIPRGLQPILSNKDAKGNLLKDAEFCE